MIHSFKPRPHQRKSGPAKPAGSEHSHPAPSSRPGGAKPHQGASGPYRKVSSGGRHRSRPGHTPRRPSYQRREPRQHQEYAGMETGVQKQSVKHKDVLRVLPIGGLEEVGRNMCALEYNDNILIIDMGLQFPEEDMPGIDYIIPNTKYLEEHKKNIDAVIITHAHYDHIGGIPHIMPRIGNPPMYGTDLTCAIIKKRQEEYKEFGPALNINVVKNDDALKIGIWNIQFFGVSHNIPGSLGVIIRTPEGIVIHTGDFKIDERSDIAGVTELHKLEKLSAEKPLLLMSDSTNAREVGHQFSEMEIKTELEDIIKNARGRLIVGTFASLLGRLNQIIQVAAKYGKKIVIEGRSMKANVEIAKELGYITVPRNTVIPVEEMRKYRNEEIIILATGAQGEDNAVLMRIANREHRMIDIEPGDTFVFSSSVIPGNERTVQRLTDRLYREGADVINYRMMDIHAGGHAKQEDLKKMIEIVKPKYFMPIEGNHSFLRIHAKVAKRAGYTDQNILIADNGQVIECKDGICKTTKEFIPAEYVFVDGLGVGDKSEVVLRDRQMMSEHGMFVIMVLVDGKTGKVKGSPDIISRGFVYLREAGDLLHSTRLKVKEIVEHSSSREDTVNWTYVRDNIREKIGQYLFTKTKKRPMVLPVIVEV